MPQILTITKLQFRRLRNGDSVFTSQHVSPQSHLIITCDDSSPRLTEASCMGSPWVTRRMAMVKQGLRDNRYQQLAWFTDTEECLPPLWVIVPTRDDIEAASIAYALTAGRPINMVYLLKFVDEFFSGYYDYINFPAEHSPLRNICEMLKEMCINYVRTNQTE